MPSPTPSRATSGRRTRTTKRDVLPPERCDQVWIGKKREMTMIALGKVKEIERLLAQGGISQRKIALQVGVSRATVSAIVTGARPDYQARARAIADEPLPDGPLGHCPTCGATVYLPCRLCHVRRKMREEEELLAARRRELRETAVRHLLHKVRLAHWKREGINPAENKVPRERTAEQEP